MEESWKPKQERHHRRRHRHHSEERSKSRGDKIPKIPDAFLRSQKKQRSESTPKKQLQSPSKKLFFSNPIPFTIESNDQNKKERESKLYSPTKITTKLSISQPLDVHDMIADEIEVTELSASSISSEEIPKPSFSKKHHSKSMNQTSSKQLKQPLQEKNVNLSYCHYADDIPPSQNSTYIQSPKMNSTTRNTTLNFMHPSIYREQTTPTVQYTSSRSYFQPSYYRLEPSSEVDTNFLNTIQSAKLQLASIRNDINISRQKRAMQESKLSRFKYTQNPFRV